MRREFTDKMDTEQYEVQIEDGTEEAVELLYYRMTARVHVRFPNGSYEINFFSLGTFDQMFHAEYYRETLGYSAVAAAVLVAKVSVATIYQTVPRLIQEGFFDLLLSNEEYDIRKNASKSKHESKI